MSLRSELEPLLNEFGLEEDLKQQILEAAKTDPRGLLAVLWKGRRVKTAPFTVVEAWKALAYKPDNPSPELRAYLEWHACRKREQKRWEVEVTEERWRKWEEWQEAKKWDELHADQARLFEDWLHEHPEQAQELVSRFQAPRKPAAGASLHQQNAYHYTGLFWLTANVLVRMHGFDKDEIAGPILQRLRIKWAGSHYDSDTVTVGCGEGYCATLKQMAEKGAHAIRNLDHYLLRVVRNEIRKESGFNRHAKPTQPLVCQWCGTSVTKPPAVCPECEIPIPIPVPRQPKKEQEQWLSIDDLEPIAPQTDSPDRALHFLEFLRSLPAHLRPYVEFLVANRGAPIEEAAVELSCSTRTIERFRKELRGILKA